MQEKLAEDTSRSASSGASWFSPAAHLLMLIGATFAVFLAGVRTEGNIAAFLLATGLALLACPPRVRVDWKTWAIALALPAAASLALLPHGFLPTVEWRRQLLAAGVPLPGSISPTPRETLYWLAILSVAVCTALFALAHPLRSRTQLIFATLAVTVCGTYAGLAIYARQTGWEFPLSPNPNEFGFFLNRNHTSTFLVSGSVAALGILGVTFRNRHWFAGTLAAICLAICVAALIFFTRSRGGIVVLLGGTLLWFAGIGSAHRSKPLLISFGAVFLAGILLLFTSPGTVRDRLVKLSGSVKERVVSADPNAAPLDGRVPIFQDTLRLIRDQPLTGVGLGNYRYVFPMYRERAIWEAPVSHPESDWLMLAAETGIPGVLALLAGIGFLIHRIWPMRSHPYWPLRWALICAVLAAACHGFVDVPAHRVALGWWMLILAGIGFQGTPREPLAASRVQHGLFIVAGLGAIALGTFLFRAQWLGGPSSPPLAAYEAEVEIIGLRFDGKMEESLNAAHAAIRTFPLAHFLHFQKGMSLQQLGRKEDADAAFKNQRTINPIQTSVSRDQGDAWLSLDADRTIKSWMDALDRRVRIDRNESDTLNGSLSLYHDLLARSADVPAVQTRLLEASRFSPEFALEWLRLASPAIVAERFPQLADTATFTQSLPEPMRLRFLDDWYRRGDRAKLLVWLDSHPDWQKSGRFIRLRRLVDEGKHAEAIQTASAEFGLKLDLPPPGGGERDSPAVAPELPSAAFFYYWRLGNVVTARRILEDARANSALNDPEVLRLSAAISAQDSRWDAAWGHVERFLRVTHPEAFP